MITSTSTTQFSLPEPLTQCAACGEQLYAGAPTRTAPGGAMHVGCYVLAMGTSRPHRHLALVVDNTVEQTRLADQSGLEPAA